MHILRQAEHRASGRASGFKPPILSSTVDRSDDLQMLQEQGGRQALEEKPVTYQSLERI